MFLIHNNKIHCTVIMKWNKALVSFFGQISYNFNESYIAFFIYIHFDLQFYLCER